MRSGFPMSFDPVIKQMLAECSFFQGLDEPWLELVAGCTRSEHFQGGSYIIRSGEIADCFHILRHGSAALELVAPPRGRLMLQTLHEGEVLGWSWLVPPHRWTYDARAISLVRTLSIDGKALLAACDANHDLGYALMRRFVPVFANRLRAARVQLLDLYAPHGGEQ
jgi:CRP-like cAMP-binding protein